MSQTFGDMMKYLKTHRDLGSQSERDPSMYSSYWAEIQFWDINRVLGLLLNNLLAKLKEIWEMGTRF